RVQEVVSRYRLSVVPRHALPKPECPDGGVGIRLCALRECGLDGTVWFEFEERVIQIEDAGRAGLVNNLPDADRFPLTLGEHRDGQLAATLRLLRRGGSAARGARIAVPAAAGGEEVGARE